MAKRKNNNNQIVKPVTEEVVETKEEVTEPVEEVVEEPVTEEVPAPEPEPIEARVANCKKVRARKNPTTEEDNVIEELEEGTAVVVIDSSNPDWTRVELAGGTRAWIMSKYLEVI